MECPQKLHGEEHRKGGRGMKSLAPAGRCLLGTFDVSPSGGQPHHPPPVMPRVAPILSGDADCLRSTRCDRCRFRPKEHDATTPLHGHVDHDAVFPPVGFASPRKLYDGERQLCSLRTDLCSSARERSEGAGGPAPEISCASATPAWVSFRAIQEFSILRVAIGGRRPFRDSTVRSRSPVLFTYAAVANPWDHAAWDFVGSEKTKSSVRDRPNLLLLERAS